MGAVGAPFSPASSLGSPESTSRAGSVNSRPPPLPAQGQAASSDSASNMLVSPRGASASGAGSSNPSQGQDQQWVDPNYRPSFAQKLHHKFDVVVDQSNTGMHLLKRVRAFMQRFSSLQERYAAELTKITSLERNKLIASAHADGMASCYTAWLGFFANMDELAVANQHFSEQLKEVTVEQLERFYSIGTQMVTHTRPRTHACTRPSNASCLQSFCLCDSFLPSLLCSGDCSDAAGERKQVRARARVKPHAESECGRS